MPSPAREKLEVIPTSELARFNSLMAELQQQNRENQAALVELRQENQFLKEKIISMAGEIEGLRSMCFELKQRLDALARPSSESQV